MKKLIYILLLISMLLFLTGCDQDNPGYTVIVDQDSNTITVDDATTALTVIDYEHYEIHEGDTFQIGGVVDLPINEVRDLRFTTPNTAEWLHFTGAISVESETEWWLYEVVTLDAAGTAVTPINLNRNSTHISASVWDYIDNTSVANANADTGLGGATVLAHGIAGAGRDQGQEEHNHEYILKQNTIYAIRFVANTAGFVVYHFDWYEHTNNN